MDEWLVCTNVLSCTCYKAAIADLCAFQGFETLCHVTRPPQVPNYSFGSKTAVWRQFRCGAGVLVVVGEQGVGNKAVLMQVFFRVCSSWRSAIVGAAVT